MGNHISNISRVYFLTEFSTQSRWWEQVNQLEHRTWWQKSLGVKKRKQVRESTKFLNLLRSRKLVTSRAAKFRFLTIMPLQAPFAVIGVTWWTIFHHSTLEFTSILTRITPSEKPSTSSTPMVRVRSPRINLATSWESLKQTLQRASFKTWSTRLMQRRMAKSITMSFNNWWCIVRKRMTILKNWLRLSISLTLTAMVS